VHAEPSFPPTFRVTVRRERERTVVVPSGELDLATVGTLEAAIERERAQGAKSVVLDLRELTFIDSTGLVMLLRVESHSRADGFTFSIKDRPGPVRRLLTLVQLRDRFLHEQP